MLRWPSVLRMTMFKTFHTKILRLHAKPLTYPRRIDVTLRHYEPANLRNVIVQSTSSLSLTLRLTRFASKFSTDSSYSNISQ